MMTGINLFVGLSLLALSHQFAYSKAGCLQDEEDERNLLKKQQFNVETTWIVFNTMTTSPLNQTSDSQSMEEYTIDKIRRKLNETIDGDRAIVVTNITGRNQFKEVDTVSFEATFSTDKRPASSGALLSADLLRTLGNLVDCNQEYRITSRGASHYCELSPAKGLLATNPNMDFNVIASSVRLKLNANVMGEIADERGCEQMCNQVISARQDFVKLGKEFTEKLYRGVVFFVSLLDPHHWLALVVAIWLTTCFFIAMLIKRRDKRRLRLYLEERTDYSFSAKRRDST